MVWIIGRVKTDGPADYDAVHQVQDALAITPLSSWGRQDPPAAVVIDPSVDMATPPLDQVNAMSGIDFFRYGAELMKVHRPHLTDWSVIARLRRIGFEVGESFDAEALDPAARQALDTVSGNAQKVLLGRLPGLARVVNGWQSNLETIGVYGDFYVKRALVSTIELGRSGRRRRLPAAAGRRRRQAAGRRVQLRAALRCRFASPGRRLLVGDDV